MTIDEIIESIRRDLDDPCREERLRAQRVEWMRIVSDAQYAASKGYVAETVTLRRR